MFVSNRQTLAELGASKRPPMLEKGSYVPWARRFMRFLENKKEGERMRNSIKVEPYERKMIQNPDKPDDPTTKIIEPLSKMTESNKQRYFSNIIMMNYLLQGIPNDIYNSVDACKTAKQIQYEPYVIASRAKKAAGNHDPLTLVAHSNVHSSHSDASPSYSHSPQPYYVTHPSLVIDHEEDYQGEIQGDAQEDKLTTKMMLLERVITQCYFTPTNNRLCTSSNTRNQAVIQDSRVDDWK
ncbi:hypothetical protein Tco_0545943 [Tanacetum coccineum]